VANGIAAHVQRPEIKELFLKHAADGKRMTVAEFHKFLTDVQKVWRECFYRKISNFGRTALILSYIARLRSKYLKIGIEDRSLAECIVITPPHVSLKWANSPTLPCMSPLANVQCPMIHEEAWP
jgi:hypothetical protein